MAGDTVSGFLKVERSRDHPLRLLSFFGVIVLIFFRLEVNIVVIVGSVPFFLGDTL